MLTVRRHRFLVLLSGLVILGLLGVACAKGEEAVAPAPAAVPSPVSAPAPTAAPAPAAPPTAALQPPAAPVAPAPAREGEPLVPGGPPFYRSKIVAYTGWQIFQRYHQDKLPLWTRAKYGGDYRIFFPTSFTETGSFRLLDILVLNRPSMAGMLLYTDMGRCSWAGREDFAICKGEQAHNKAVFIVPGIFQKWEQPNPLTYVFTVRRGVLWPATPPMARPDREVTAEDIAWFLDVTKREGILKQNFALVDRFEAVDRYTLRATMTAPNADFLNNVAHTSMGLFPKECYEQKGCLGAPKSVSPGPFLVKQHEPLSKLIFDKNPEFHLKGLPYVDRISLFNVVDPAAQLAGFRTGKNDNYKAGTLPEAEKLLRELPGTQLHAQGGIGGVTMTLRPQLKGPLADVRVRRALTMALDLPTLWTLAYDGFSMPGTLISRDYFGEEFYMTVEQMSESYQFNPQKAKQLLAEAGYPNGFSVDITGFANIVPYGDYATAVQGQWKKYLGVEVKTPLVDIATARTRLYEKTWEGFHFNGACWIASCWGTADDAFAQFVRGSPQNFQRLDDPTINDLYLKQRGELDPAKRIKSLWDFEQYELSQVYMVRMGVATILTMMPPWEMNGASHETAWFVAFNGPTWLAMHDTSKYPSGR